MKNQNSKSVALVQEALVLLQEKDGVLSEIRELEARAKSLSGQASELLARACSAMGETPADGVSETEKPSAPAPAAPTPAKAPTAAAPAPAPAPAPTPSKTTKPSEPAKAPTGKPAAEKKPASTTPPAPAKVSATKPSAPTSAPAKAKATKEAEPAKSKGMAKAKASGKESGDPATDPSAPDSPFQKKGRARTAIVELLRSTGKPMHVKEVAEALGKTEDAVYVWFSSNGKLTPGITKISRGVYAWTEPN
jgi:outer membrane biosynthesis protein TonB